MSRDRVLITYVAVVVVPYFKWKFEWLFIYYKNLQILNVCTYKICTALEYEL